MIAQQRPGLSPRRHALDVAGEGRRHARSTKAGALTPATRAVSGLHGARVVRSTKAGALTPATPAGPPPPSGRIAPPLNKGRGSHPCDTRGRRRDPPTRGAPNKGRGSHPGDTSCARLAVESVNCAQQRPGLSPRRHFTPNANAIFLTSAQQRPGLSPRRHPRHRTVPDGDPARSTKAGALTPATLPRPPAPASTLRSLNKGRGSHPGDTRQNDALPICFRCAQQRPGLSPRRHYPDHLAQAQRTQRSTKAGALTPATPDLDAGAARVRVRSTKAGALTPATRGSRPCTGSGAGPLNKGRGSHPGDTQTHPWSAPGGRSLNKGRGSHPGDTAISGENGIPEGKQATLAEVQTAETASLQATWKAWETWDSVNARNGARTGQLGTASQPGPPDHRGFADGS